MGLFDFFRKNQQNSGQINNNSIDQKHAETTEIPKDLFIEEANPNDRFNLSTDGFDKGIDTIYSFLQADYESKGYSDALVNPDDSYKNDNIKLIKLDLRILIERTSTYYEDQISVLNHHLLSRSRAGFVDLIQELEARKKQVEDHKMKLKQIVDEIENEDSICQRIILSYQRGFMKGLSALTQSNVLNNKL